MFYYVMKADEATGEDQIRAVGHQEEERTSSDVKTYVFDFSFGKTKVL